MLHTVLDAAEPLITSGPFSFNLIVADLIEMLTVLFTLPVPVLKIHTVADLGPLSRQTVSC